MLRCRSPLRPRVPALMEEMAARKRLLDALANLRQPIADLKAIDGKVAPVLAGADTMSLAQAAESVSQVAKDCEAATTRGSKAAKAAGAVATKAVAELAEARAAAVQAAEATKAPEAAKAAVAALERPVKPPLSLSMYVLRRLWFGDGQLHIILSSCAPERSTFCCFHCSKPASHDFFVILGRLLLSLLDH